MRRMLIGSLADAVGSQVKIQGWVHAIRNHKTMQFVMVRDHTGMVQVTNYRDHENLSKTIDNLTPESAVEITGRVVGNDSVRLNRIEIIPGAIIAHSIADTRLPIQSDTGIEHRLDWRFLDLRTSRNRLIFEVQTCAEEAMRDYWARNGFIEIHTPKLMHGASESGAELFTVDYFDRKACLAQSPQFYKQMAMAAGFERVFEIGPVFRANPSFTSRHDTEFTSVDMEISWIDSHEDVMQMEERWLRHLITAISEQFGSKIRELYHQDVLIPVVPFPRLTMAQAHAVLAEYGHIIPGNTKQGDIDPEGERILGQYARETHGHQFIFITDYPWSIRPFYHMRQPEDPSVTRSFDLLWNGLEVTTGAQREHRHDILRRQATEKGLHPEEIEYYLDFFRYGCPTHGGLGFGLSRMLMILFGLGNVREVTYLYRGPKRITP